MPRLILMCGLPGAGKTTQARHLAATLPAIRLSPDEWLTGLGLNIFDLKQRDRVEQVLWQHAQDLLRLGQDVILENGFWARTERDGYRDTARTLGATVHLHYLDTPLDVLKHRRRDLLTTAQMDDCAALFDTPDATELAPRHHAAATTPPTPSPPPRTPPHHATANPGTRSPNESPQLSSEAVHPVRSRRVRTTNG